MFTKKIKYLIGINLILFIAVVFLGIELGGRGAKISKLENDIEKEILIKRDISEIIFNSDQIKDNEKLTDLGYMKPNNVLYFDTEDLTAKLPVR